MNAGIIIGILIVGVPCILRIVNAKKRYGRKKINYAAMEREMGRLDFIIQEKTKCEQQLKLVPVLLIMGIGLLAVGIILSMAGWRGVATIIMMAIICIVVSIYAKAALPKKIAEYEWEIKNLQEAKNGQ
jgi:hypothetical protein